MVTNKLNASILNFNRIGIVSYDAGGANILNCLVKKFDNIEFSLLIDGPAKKIFDCNNAIFFNNTSLFFDQVDFIIFGTGTTSYEKKLLRQAKDDKIPTAAILEHFINFRQRFIYKDKICFPDYCFVCDEEALDIAKRDLYPYSKISICDNFYIDYVKNHLGDKPNTNSNKVLYILADIKENWGRTPAWSLAFNNFYKNFFMKNDSLQHIIVRPHPADDTDIYVSLEKYKEVTFDYMPSGIYSLREVCVVVGLESYFLYLAKKCGYDVYSSMPQGIRDVRLPKSSFNLISEL